MNLTLLDKETGKEMTSDEIVKISSLFSGLGYEDWGLQSDGQPVVFDKCGNFGYLDVNKVMVCINL